MTMMGRRRPAWVGWIPAAILSVIILGAVVATVLVYQSGLAEPPPPPTEEQVTDGNLSVFTDDGVAYIERTREVRFNLSAPPVSAREIGLPADGTVSLEPLETGLPYSLRIFGGGAKPGGLTLVVTDVTIETSAGVLTSIRAPTGPGASFSDVLNTFEAKAAVYGWDMSSTDRIVDEMGQATRDGRDYTFMVGPGDALGVSVRGTATCAADGCSVEYEVAPRAG